MLFTYCRFYSVRTVAVFATSLLLTSCGLFGGDERPVYQGAEYYKNLEVPPTLTRPDTTDEVKIPKPSEEALQRFRDNNKLDTVITPKFDGVRIVNYAGDSWIETDNDVEHVWPRILEFWQREGIDLVEVRPLLGFVETDWVKKLGPEEGFLRSLFQSFEPDQKDKFRVRVERFDDGKKTRIYLAHSRMERVVSGEDVDDLSWVSRPSDIEAEREIIARMGLFIGLSKEQSTALLENYRPYSSLVKKDGDNSSVLTMKGSMDFVWRRAVRALDRMQMLDVKQDQANNTIRFAVGKIAKRSTDVEEDELAESSWLMQLFTDKGGDISENVNRQYRLVFTDQQDRIKVEVKDARNTLETDEDGYTSSTAMAEQLRDVLAEELE